MIVEKRMTRNPITVHPDTTVIDAQALMRREKISRLPVVDRNGRLVGIVSEKDLIYASPSRASTLDVYEMNFLLSKLTVETVMTKKVITIDGDTPVEDAARIMVDNDIGGLPVMKGNTLVGIITESDIFKMFLELFGTREKGLRVTLMISEEKGSLARLTAAIFEHGGNIVSTGTFLGEDLTNAMVVMKIIDLDRETIVRILTPLSEKIVDIRET
jgi:acetoin utilization protein AcuB